MNLNFYKNMISKLLEKEYTIIKNCYDDKEISEKSQFIGLLKQNGSVLNFVFLVRLDTFDGNMNTLISSFEYDSRTISSNANIRNIVSIFIFVGGEDDISDEILNICEQNIFNPDDEFISIRWIADTKNKKLLIKGNQPNKIYGIEDIINSSFENTIDNDSQNFNDIPQALKNNDEKQKSWIRTDNCILTVSLAVINIIVFLIMELNGGSGKNLIKFGAIVPDLIVNHGEYYRLFTAMFLHIGIVHLAFNLFSLLILGMRVEKYYGKIPYLIIYILSGIICSLFSTIFTGNVAAGASGAIFGLNGAILSYTFYKKKSMLGIDLYMIITMIILGLGFGYITTNVDNFGHLGGFIGGLIISATYLLIDNNRKKGE